MKSPLNFPAQTLLRHNIVVSGNNFEKGHEEKTNDKTETFQSFFLFSFQQHRETMIVLLVYMLRFNGWRWNKTWWAGFQSLYCKVDNEFRDIFWLCFLKLLDDKASITLIDPVTGQPKPKLVMGILQKCYVTATSETSIVSSSIASKFLKLLKGDGQWRGGGQRFDGQLPSELCSQQRSCAQRNSASLGLGFSILVVVKISLVY